MLILNSHVRPPVEYYIREDFESGALRPEWDAAWGAVAIDTWANLGIPASPSGQSRGRQILSNNGLSGHIAETDDIWMTVREYFEDPDEWEAVARVRYDDNEVLSLDFTSGGKYAVRAPAYSASWQIGTTVFSDNSWSACKVHVYVHETAGIIQLWSLVSGVWQLEVDLHGVATGRTAAPAVNIVDGPRQSKDDHYCDEINFSTSDHDLKGDA